MSILSKAFFHIRKTSFYKRLLFSYILGLLIVLLVISLVCVNLVDTISNFSNQTAADATAQFQATVESMVDSIQRLPTELSLDSAVAALMSSQQSEFNARQRYSVIALSAQLKSYCLLNPYISDIFLYFPLQDYLISGQSVYTWEQWTRVNLQNSELADILASEDSIRWERLGGTGKLSDKTIMCSKLPSENNVAQPVLCVFLDPVLEEFSGAQGTNELSSFYTVNSDSSILFSGGFSDIPNVSLARDLIRQSAGQDHGVINLQEDYIGYTAYSEAYNFYHMYFSPEGAFFSTLRTSKQIVVLSCVFILMLGVVLSIVAARRTSRPILRIANLIREDGKDENPTLEAIEQSVISLVQIKKKASSNTEQYKKLHLESLLLKLLHQEIANEVALNSIMEENDISVSGDSFLVASVSPVADFPLEAISQQFCSVFRTHTPDSVELYFFRGSGELKIVAAGWKNFFTVASVKEGFQKTIQYLEASRQIQLRVAVSEIHSGLFELGLAYEETQRVNEYSNFIGVNLVLDYGELLATQSGNENSLIFDMWFNKFANTLMNQDFTAAHKIQKNIFNELSKHEYSLQFVKCKIFSFIDRTINVIGELDIVYTTQLWDDLKLADRLLACDTLAELEDVYSDIFSQLTRIVLDTERKETKSELILSIIQKQYTKPDFSVSTVADQLGSSVPYVSRTFKEEFGCNMLDYIQKLRIDLAKKLLTEHPDITVAQISGQCGFNNNITFTRVFKNYEGISPGKYRNQVGSSPKTP